MRLYYYLILFILIQAISCKESSYQNLSEYLRLNVGADELKIAEIKDSVVIDLYYKTPPLMGFDFKSSSAAMQCIDTARDMMNKKSQQFIKVNIHSNQQILEYSYPIADLAANQIGMDITTLFLQNFLSGQNEQNARYVDLDKISLEDLFNLNTVNEQIQSNVQITYITFDGFSTHNSEPHNVEFRGNLQGESEVFPFVSQYDKNKKKIFYFGINE
ncbi:MAG: hypothetical protein ACK58Q_00400 [Chitinophagales bacterium]